MKEIRVTPLAQLVIVGAVLAALVAMFGPAIPEVRRYLKVRRM
jgi:hypothetical protein